MLRPATDVNSWVGRPLWATLAQVEPVANVADFAYSTGWMAAKFTTTAPHASGSTHDSGAPEQPGGPSSAPETPSSSTTGSG